ncbi:hypothetical protein [Pseudomonas sp.]|nr:hypothetical protein [Pseudomonas sp.]
MGSGNTPGKDSQTPSDYDEYGDLPESPATTEKPKQSEPARPDKDQVG